MSISQTKAKCDYDLSLGLHAARFTLLDSFNGCCGDTGQASQFHFADQAVFPNFSHIISVLHARPHSIRCHPRQLRELGSNESFILI